MEQSLEHKTYLATIPTGKLRMNEGTDASSRTTNICITVYVALSGFGLASVGTFTRNMYQGHACDVRFVKKQWVNALDAGFVNSRIRLARITTTASNINTYQTCTTRTAHCWFLDASGSCMVS